MTKEQAKRDQIAIREEYRDAVADMTLTTFFRPGERVYPEHEKSYFENQRVYPRVIEIVGDNSLNIDPVFFDEPNTPATVTSVTVKRIGELEPEDFIGSSDDVQDKEGLRAQLKRIYKMTDDELCDRTKITRVKIVYAPEPLVLAK